MTQEILCRTIEGHDMSADIDRSDPARPAIHLECSCNEFWLDADEAFALLEYLTRTLPKLQNSGT
jgi:hypothetical protein